MTKILIYEDNSQLREVLSILINSDPKYVVQATYGHCANALADIKTHDPDLILMDIDMPFVNGISGLKLLRESGFRGKIIMLTVFDDNGSVFDAIKAGANGYILKKTPPAKILEYIEDALNGGAPMTSSIAAQVLHMLAEGKTTRMSTFDLSAREKDVLDLLVEGYSYKMIADKLFISMDTVRSHIKKIYEKLQVNSKSEAVVKALRNNPSGGIGTA
ncbi:response regulator transcription factor [Sphingobacterium sp. InxBP1]|uniref:response regulator n=1 Tax=Sphingobacterium sp. InxBP1 TaxID=2870328 RepID=UPI002243B173|nr:response regulator transcription factor [Sphingobacterium sp. InxBP1]MCW8311151.1 response regulator transcription factor [Sphingobacterium sp. InxBP1]